MRLKYLIIISIQIVLLIGIIAYREYWVSTGNKIILKTAPVDPRDIFRGDYVNLNYQISSLDLDALSFVQNFRHNQSVFVTLGKDDKGFYRALSVGMAKPGSGTFIQGRVRNSMTATRYMVTVLSDDGETLNLEPRWIPGVKNGERAYFCLGPRNNVIFFNAESEKYKPKCDKGRTVSGRVIDIKETKFRQLNVEYGIESYFVEEGKGRDIEKMRNEQEVYVEVSLRSDGKGIISGLLIDGKKIFQQ